MNQEKETVYVIGHKNPDTDSIAAAIGYADYLTQRGSFPDLTIIPARAGAINSETAFALERFGITSPKLLDDAAGQKIILVDHAESTQMVTGADRAEVLGVLDHHRVAFIHHSPIFFHTETVGSTATIVGKKYFEDAHLGVSLSPQISGLLLCAILSDTVIFRSSTTTSKDRDVAGRLAEIAGVYNVQELGIELKQAALKGLKNAADLIHDFKEYNLGDLKVGVGQVEVVTLAQILEHRVELLCEINRLKNKEGYDLVILMVTDILQIGTEVLAVGQTTCLEQALNKTLENGSFYVPGMISRKKDLIPPLEKWCRRSESN